jgi:hypothetical protein
MSAEKLRFSSATFVFQHEAVAVFLYPQVGPRLNNSAISVPCEHLDWQVSSIAQVCNVLGPLFSTVVDLSLDYRQHSLSSEGHDQVDLTWWHSLLGSFRNVETLRVHNGLVAELSRSLQSDGEPPLGLLPELKVLACPVGSVNDKAFATFIRDREVAGQPVNLIGEAFPVGRCCYRFHSPNGISLIAPEPDPLP